MANQRLEIKRQLSSEELGRWYRNCKDGKEKTRWQAIWLYEQGVKTQRISEVTGFSRNWVYKLVQRYNDEGPQGLVDEHRDHPGGDKRAILKLEQQQALFKALQSKAPGGGLWTAPKVAAWVKDQTGKTMAASTAWTYLRRLGFSLQIPRPSHFKKTREVVEEQQKQHPDKNIELWSQDETRLGLKPILRKVWALRGRRPVAHHCTRYEWLYVYIFLCPKTGQSYFLILPSVSTEIMNIALVEFVQDINPNQDKVIVLMLDNAGGAHRSKPRASARSGGAQHPRLYTSACSG